MLPFAQRHRRFQSDWSIIVRFKGAKGLAGQEHLDRSDFMFSSLFRIPTTCSSLNRALFMAKVFLRRCCRDVRSPILAGGVFRRHVTTSKRWSSFRVSEDSLTFGVRVSALGRRIPPRQATSTTGPAPTPTETRFDKTASTALKVDTNSLRTPGQHLDGTLVGLKTLFSNSDRPLAQRKWQLRRCTA